MTLFVSLVALLIVTALAMGLMRGLVSQEREAGSTREKQKAQQAAQSALLFGEWWLLQGNAGTGVTCNGQSSALQVCSNTPLAGANSGDIASFPWNFGTYYTPTQVGGAASMTFAAQTANGYAAQPQIYVQYLGLSSDGTSRLYQVSAAAAGGTSSAVAVVQSTFAVSTGATDLGGL